MSDISAPLGDGKHASPHSGSRTGIDPWVFGIAAGISTAFVIWGVLDSRRRAVALGGGRAGDSDRGLIA
jgi:hypothetical protein